MKCYKIFRFVGGNDCMGIKGLRGCVIILSGCLGNEVLHIFLYCHCKFYMGIVTIARYC